MSFIAKVNFFLRSYLFYQLEAYFLAENHLNSCPDSDLRKIDFRVFIEKSTHKSTDKFSPPRCILSLKVVQCSEKILQVFFSTTTYTYRILQLLSFFLRNVSFSYYTVEKIESLEDTTYTYIANFHFLW